MGLESLARMEYPGRFIILGKDSGGEHAVVVYGLTGRSPPSRARRLEPEKDQVRVVPVDEQAVSAGNRDLLVYPAMMFKRQGIAVSNGAHTESIAFALETPSGPLDVLNRGMYNFSYEPDDHFTPRIGGVMMHQDAALCVVKRAEDNSCVRNFFHFSLLRGKGVLVSTYAGHNVNPLSPFSGEPLSVDLEGESPEVLARNVFDCLCPDHPEFRVGVCVVYENLFTRGKQVVDVRGDRT